MVLLVGFLLVMNHSITMHLRVGLVIRPHISRNKLEYHCESN